MGPGAYGPQKWPDFFAALYVRYGSPDGSIKPPWGRSGLTLPQIEDVFVRCFCQIFMLVPRKCSNSYLLCVVHPCSLFGVLESWMIVNHSHVYTFDVIRVLLINSIMSIFIIFTPVKRHNSTFLSTLPPPQKETPLVLSKFANEKARSFFFFFGGGSVYTSTSVISVKNTLHSRDKSLRFNFLFSNNVQPVKQHELCEISGSFE